MGSAVRWNVHAVAGDWVGDLLGQPWGATVRLAEDHHDTGQGAASELAGVVPSIRVVTAGLELQPGTRHGRVLVPVPGSGRLRGVEVADRWDPQPPEGQESVWSFEGWIVGLAVEDTADEPDH